MLVAFAFYDRLADVVLAPILSSLPAGSSLVFIKPGEGFSFYLNISLIGGLLLSAPFVMDQVWRFIAPGLYANEKKMVIPFVALTSAGSLGGAIFSHVVLFPAGIRRRGRRSGMATSRARHTSPANTALLMTARASASGLAASDLA